MKHKGLCHSCGAPLPSYNSRCSYCGTLNDNRFHADTRHPVEMTLLMRNGEKITFNVAISDISTSTAYADSYFAEGDRYMPIHCSRNVELSLKGTLLPIKEVSSEMGREVFWITEEAGR